MKKFLCAIAMLLAFVPFIGVKALNETTNYYNYKKGQVVNFYTNKTLEANKNSEALYTMIVEDKDTSEKFIRTWAFGSSIGYAFDDNALQGSTELIQFLSGLYSAYATDHTNPANVLRYHQQGSAADNEDFVLPYDTQVGGFGSGIMTVNPTYGNTSGGATGHNPVYTWDFFAMDLPTVADFGTMFGDENVVETSRNHYTLKNANIVDRNGQATTLYETLSLSLGTAAQSSIIGQYYKNGFYVLDFGAIEPILMIAETTYSGDTITNISIRPAEASDNGEYFVFMPILYMNKTADCHETREMCYICGTEYKWEVVGNQAADCKEVANAKTLADCAPEVCYQCKDAEDETKFKYFLAKLGNSDYSECEVVDKAKCNSKTGVESHILEFAIVAALCAIALIVVKRKDLFKAI